MSLAVERDEIPERRCGRALPLPLAANELCGPADELELALVWDRRGLLFSASSGRLHAPGGSRLLWAPWLCLRFLLVLVDALARSFREAPTVTGAAATMTCLAGALLMIGRGNEPPMPIRDMVLVVCVVCVVCVGCALVLELELAGSLPAPW